ncbi:MAG: TonB family protein [Saprospiraceae bacterium]|nr:TonB family protein [Candidatus Brachybacter algidus]
MHETYYTTFEKLSDSQLIRKIYFPETKQITHLITYNSIHQNEKHGPYKEWLDDGTLYVNGRYSHNVQSGLWLVDGKTGYYLNGEKDGLWENYNGFNELLSTEMYEHGKLNGWTFNYDSTGIKKDSVLYIKGEYVLKDVIAKDGKSIIKVTETKPQFKKGQGAFYEYLNSNIKYPNDAKKHGITGKAIVEFTIEKNGEVTDIKVIRGLCNSITGVCYELFKTMPDWSPGMQNGIPVRVQYSLPITFNLEAD